MLHDLNGGPLAAPGRFDVCVIGAGPAGITLAMDLAKKNKRVALCEAGAFELTQLSQDNYKGAWVGDPYLELDAIRLRYFGGTSGHWTGYCRPLDEIDFLRKDRINPDAHWPIERRDLDPYLADACAVVQVKPPPASRVIAPELGLQEDFFSFSRPPVRFGDKYRKPIVASKTITLLLNANLVGVEAKDGRITSCIFQSYNQKNQSIVADKYVFAMGGIENSRQLLWHAARSPGNICSPEAPLGRYWMDHPHYTIGGALVSFKAPAARRFFGLTPQKQMQLGVLNCGLRLEPASQDHTQRMIKELVCVAPALGEWAASLAHRSMNCGIRIRAAWEAAPVFDNRVALSPSRKDRFGIPAPTLYWRHAPLDLKTLRATALQFNAWLTSRKLGRLRLEPWVLGRGGYPSQDELGGPHLMGGTRMADNPREGVVDRNCQVFGSKNLFMAGSSVFSSSGHSNPTLTILQLALRLSDHLTA
ncbi:MAG: GMC family oxidoreductase [Caulobacterales bacterium]|nr:GMC family oxidoreductase [Caulobacterales bacterium]